MSHLYNWINCILITVTIVGIIEFIIPEGEIRKFAVLILGIITSVMIVTPVITFFKGNIELEEVFDFSKIEENSYYIEALRGTTISQTGMLEGIFARNIVDTFNRSYSDMKLESCVVYFEKDIEGKIKNISGIQVEIKNKTDNIKELKRRVASLCEVDTEKVEVNIK